MVENYLSYFVITFFGFCTGGFVGASMASGYFRAKYEREMKRQKDLYDRL